MIQQFTFSDLAEFDGGVIAAAVNAAMKRASEDCDDRPGVKAARTITLKLTFKPIPDDRGMCEEARFGFQMSETMPKRESKQYTMGLRKGGKLTFNPDALDNHKQETFKMGDQQ